MLFVPDKPDFAFLLFMEQMPCIREHKMSVFINNINRFLRNIKTKENKCFNEH